MKMLISLFLLSLGGSAGWLLNSSVHHKGTAPIVAEVRGNTSVQQASAPTRVVGTPLDASTGDNLLFEKAFISHAWIRSIRPDGRLGSKHLFIKVKESPPLSGSFQLVRYAFYNRPDLLDRLPIVIEPVMRGEISTIIQTQGVPQPLMRVWLQEPHRMIDVREEEFPKTLEEAWQIAHGRLQHKNLSGT